MAIPTAEQQPYPEGTENESSTPQEQQPKPPSPKPRDPDCMENRLRPVAGKSTLSYSRQANAADVVNRLIWDPAFDAADYLIGYEDRFEGRLETGVRSWKRDLADEEFIPQHRILYIRRRSDGEVVWDRRRRIDRVFWSGNSACMYLDFLG